MKPIGQLSPQEWLSHPATVRVIKALSSGGKPARFVGGCARDALLNKPIADVDIATPESPERSQYLLEEAGIRVVPVGLSHGAILAVTDEMSFHVTTLRRDVETFGRQAKVHYVDDWEEDAKRRDFTMNALYVDLDGTLYDPCNGIEDIKAGRVRFIGHPEQRIKEDYLRILRFFRFQAYYGKEPPEKEDLLACKRAASHLKILSTERIWYELKRLLKADDPIQVLMWMQQYDIFDYIFPFTINDKSIQPYLARMVKLEEKYNAPKRAIRRLACLFNSHIYDAQHIRESLPLSTHDIRHLIKLTKLVNDQPDLGKPFQLYRLLYNQGAEVYYDYILLLAAHDEKVRVEKYLEVLSHWTSPELPIQGKDLLELGLSAGPKIGRTLEELTDWWLENKCLPNKEQCIEWLRRNKL